MVLNLRPQGCRSFGRCAEVAFCQLMAQVSSELPDSNRLFADGADATGTGAAEGMNSRKPNVSAMNVADFFRPWEKEIKTFDEINDVLSEVFEERIAEGRRFAWRGMVCGDWPLHSSLYRRHLCTTTGPTAPNEKSLSALEDELLAEVHRWGLHNGARGRLSIFEQLATLQHFGAPTRLIDVTLNAYVGLWFAVEQKWENGVLKHDNDDGRLFAIDVTDRLINEDDARRSWEDELTRPWNGLDPLEWSAKTWAWQPPALEARISSQHGAFLFGGVPRTGARIRWPKGPTAGSGSWGIDSVRRAISVPLRLHKAEPEAGGVSTTGQPAYTYRIKAEAKRDIRERLQRLFGYSHATIYRDYPGFADFGMPELKRH
jgi:hypothetical protein